MKNNFNVIAPFYDALARLVFGYKLELAQQYFLGEIKADSKVLIVGGGTGKLLEWLPQNHGLNIDYVELSEAMIARAKKRHEHGNRVIFQTKDVLEISGNYDIVITNFFLDCFDGKDLNDVIRHINSQLKSGGLWLVTDFSVPTSPKQKMLLWTMHSFFKLVANLKATSLQDIKERLGTTGLKLSKEELFSSQIIFSAVYTKP